MDSEKLARLDEVDMWRFGYEKCPARR